MSEGSVQWVGIREIGKRKRRVKATEWGDHSIFTPYFLVAFAPHLTLNTTPHTPPLPIYNLLC
jgi:hypothetical protein